MQSKLATLLAAGNYPLGEDGIYSAPDASIAHDQVAERELRENVAAQQYDDYLAAVAQSHSIPVMDHEVDRFLKMLPHGAVILDVGGCWGWHWRRLAETRPDVGVLIVDFVRANLTHARKSLGSLVGAQVAVMCAEATALPFCAGTSSEGFDGVWSVQVFQHIPDFRRACAEAHRVLRNGGRFASYSLFATPLNRAIYRLFGRPFHEEGMVEGQYHLNRANDRQRRIVEEVFGSVRDRYTECLFHPDLKFAVSGKGGSLLGRLDAHLAGFPLIGRLFARQRSFEAKKN